MGWLTAFPATLQLEFCYDEEALASSKSIVRARIDRVKSEPLALRESLIMSHTTFPLVAVDIGNTRLKLGLFAEPPGDPPGHLPAPERTLEAHDERFEAIADWLDPHDVSQVGWWIGSVQRAMTTEFVDWLRRREAVGPIVLLCCEDLPLTVDLPRPDMAGIDRLLAAVAANQLREQTQPAIVVPAAAAR